MADLDRAVGDGVGDLQAGDDFAGREDLHLNLLSVISRDGLREGLGGAVDRVERLREARRHAPADLGRRLGDGRLGDDGGGRASRGGGQKLTTLHAFFSLMFRDTPACNFLQSSSAWDADQIRIFEKCNTNK